MNACTEKGEISYFDTIIIDCVELLKHFDNVLVIYIHNDCSGRTEQNVNVPDFIHHK